MIYSLKEAAEECSCSENKVLRVAIDSKIGLRVEDKGWFQAYTRKRTNGEVGDMVPKCHNNGYLAIWWQELLKFLPNHDEAVISEFKNVTVDTTKRGVGWKRFEKNRMGYRVDEDGNAAPLNIKRSDLIIFEADILVLKKEVTAKRTEILTDGGDQEQTPSRKKETGNGGGRPQSPFGEAVEKAYRFFLESGNTEILKPFRRDDFRKSLLSLVKDEDKEGLGNCELSSYVAERIKEQKTVDGELKIFCNERPASKGKKPFPAQSYTMDDLSDELSKLRGKYPLPS